MMLLNVFYLVRLIMQKRRAKYIKKQLQFLENCTVIAYRLKSLNEFLISTSIYSTMLNEPMSEYNVRCKIIFIVKLC